MAEPSVTQKLHVALLIDTWFPEIGGGQTNAWEISKLLAQKENVTIDIFTRSLKVESEQKELAADYAVQGLQVFRLKPTAGLFNWLIRLLWLGLVIVKVIQEHMRQPYDLIHAHANAAIIPGKILSMLLRKPLIVTVHGFTFADLQKQTVLSTTERWLLTRLKADHIISVQARFAAIPHWHTQVTVISNGVDLKMFQKVKISKEKIFKFIWLGRFDPIKGLPILFEAVKELSRKSYDFQLHLLGKGNVQETLLKSMVSKLEIDPYVKFRGLITGEEKIKELKSAEVLVLPSLSEGQPITVLEAAAAGLPVIATKVGDNDSYIMPKKNGWLVPPGDVHALAQALEDAMTMPREDLRKMGGKNYDMLAESYTWVSTAEKTWKVYNTATSKK